MHVAHKKVTKKVTMSSTALGFLSLILLVSLALAEEPRRAQDQLLQHCHHKPVGCRVLGALPGNGWDNLQNVAMPVVLMLNYTNCRMTSDGKFLVPDHVDVTALKESEIDVHWSLVSNFCDYTSVTSHSINARVDYGYLPYMISGSYSPGHVKVREQISGGLSVISRLQVLRRQYDVAMQPDSPPDPHFLSRIQELALSIHKNDTTNTRHMADWLVHDYGTHYVSKVVAGAYIVQEDQLTYSYAQGKGSNTTSMKASASAIFMGRFGIDIGYKHRATKEQINEYAESRMDSHIDSAGGSPVGPNSSISDWLKHIDNNLVIIDRDGEPLHYVLTSDRFPMLPLDTLRDVQAVVKKAVHRYYERNTYRGCTSVDSPNFNYSANLDDGSCRKPPTNHTFGGVYQSCNGSLCKAAWTLRNRKTGNSSCASGYAPVLMHTESHRHKDCKKKCHNVVGIHYKCKHKCKWVNDAVHIESYWCAANAGSVAPDSGYLFGGVYTDTTANPLTNDKSCPENYVALRLGMDSGMYVCVSDDDELAYRYSVPFGGFFSCDAGNPLALRHDITASQVQLNDFF